MSELISKSFISDLVWIKRGVAKKVPEKVEIEKEELKDLLQADVEETSDDNESMDEEALIESNTEKTSIRGSACDLTAGLEKYKMEDYDKEDDNITGPSLKGLAYYASPLEDPHITQTVDSDEEEEREDFEIKDTDNLVAVAKIVKDESSLEIYVYNEDSDDWYLHHDYIIEAPALCLAPFSYDPGADDRKGNLLAVGTMDSVINVWDLDIVNAIEPVLTLGTSNLLKKAKKATKSSRKKRDGSAQTHTDSVLCLDWNQLAEHVLASGSADKTTILWDLDEAKPATVIPNTNGMVQTLQWHPTEQSVVLSGTRTGRIYLTDCRNVEEQTSVIEWVFSGKKEEEIEVEKVIWNHFNPFCIFACSSDGKLRYLDTRKPGEVVSEVSAHEEGANSVSQSFSIKGLISTVGTKELKIWKLKNDSELQHIYTHPVNMGNVSVTKFSPDSGTTLAIGAQGEELVRVFDLSKFPEVVADFNA